MTHKSWMAMAVVAVFLTACGGGGDDNAPAVTEAVPPSASASSKGFIEYLQELVMASADLLEPVDVSAVTPPSDDASEPTPVN